MKNFIEALAFALIVLQVHCLYKKTLPVGTALTSSDIDKFRADELVRHNYFRSLHINTGNLTLNSTLNNVAQNYADYLFANKKFEHSGNGYGENLYKAWGIPSITMHGRKASNSWYKERKSYNYRKGTSKDGGEIGHFTAMIWDDVTSVGFGYACG